MMRNDGKFSDLPACDGGCDVSDSDAAADDFPQGNQINVHQVVPALCAVRGAGGNDDSRRIVFHGGYAHGGGWFGGSGVPRMEGEEPADGGACGVCGGAGGAGDSAAVLMIIATKKGIVSEIMDAIPLLVIPDCPAASAELP